jgi:hypothetical protein
MAYKEPKEQINYNSIRILSVDIQINDLARGFVASYLLNHPNILSL